MRIDRRGAAAPLVGLLLLAACRGAPPGAAGPGGGLPGPGTKRMAERLERITRELDPVRNRFLNSERLAFVRRALANTTDPERRLRLNWSLAEELLKVGAAEQAIALAQGFLRPEARAAAFAPPERTVRSFLAIAFYRLGLQQNCGARPNAERCILPIRAGGVHEEPAAMRAAMREWLWLLADRPDDRGARWLLNLAAMAAGDHPGRVPARHLLPASIFASEYPLSGFDNAAPRVGLDATNHAGGAILDDLDGDGLLDVLVSSMGPRDPLRLFRNQGDGRFAERGAGLDGLTGGLNLIHADYDNDGDIDVLVLRGGWMQQGGAYPNSLLRNRGDGTFDDVTEEAGLLSFNPTQTAAWGDYDGDGWLDLAVGNESQPPFDPHPSELYRNNGDGTFADVSKNLGRTDLGYVKGVAWGDVDNDGDVDFYVSVFGGDNVLLRNDGPRRVPGPEGEDWVFTDVTAAAGVAGPPNSFPVWFWDYDNDGWLDLLVSGYLPTDAADVAAMYLGGPTRTDMPRLYRNRGDGTFEDVTRAARLDRVALPMGANTGDLDNDGWPDAYFGTGQPNLDMVIPNRMFRNDGGRVFQEVTVAARVGHLQKGHGVAFGDIDEDGDQDIFEQMGGFFECDTAQNVLYLNPGGGGGHLTLRLRGRRANRSAIGARVRVDVRTPGGPRAIHALAGPGGSFGGNSLQVEIGLADATAIEAVTVAWPGSGTLQVFRRLLPGRIYRLEEDRDEPVAVPARRLDL